jgi:hypothetical protein
MMNLFNGKIVNPYWVVGFPGGGEGCFSVGVFKNTTLRLGYQVQLELVSRSTKGITPYWCSL